MAEFALVVPFAGLGVDLVGVVNDLPPHVTVLYPCPGEPLELAKVLEPFDQFDVTFARLDRFPGVLWLAPEPAEPFVTLTEAVVSRFPDWQPYGGVYKSVIPHLTLAQSSLDDVAVQVEPLLPLASRVESVVLYRSVDGVHWREDATFDL
ncbi:MAG: 2'-5' RNA ligase family protein [Actinomycetota bacterium]